METIATATTQKQNRFKFQGADVIYRLFDAFLEKTIIEDCVIDFSKPVVCKDDGSFEFVGKEESFTDMMNGFPVEEVKKNISEYKRKFGEFSETVEKYMDFAFAEKPCAPRVPKESKAPKKMKTETEERFQERVNEYNVRKDYLEGKYQEKMAKYAVDLKEFESQMDSFKETSCGEVAQHLYWLWSLGMMSVETSCGRAGTDLESEDCWSESLEGFDPMSGLWDVKMTTLGIKKELILLHYIFKRFTTWPNMPTFKTVEDVKKCLVDFVFKSKLDLSAPIRNGMLHLCNPDKFINIYSYEDKIGYIEKHEDLLTGYKVADLTRSKIAESCFYSASVEWKDNEYMYQSIKTEDKICYIYDQLNR